MNFSQFLAAANISKVNCDKMLKDRLRQPHMKVSEFNADFSSLSADLSGLKRPAHESVKYGYPFKSGYFTDIGSFSIKHLQIRREILLIITSTSDELLRGVNINDL